jgi:cell division septation protein DedD
MSAKPRCAVRTTAVHPSNERGVAMITLLVTVIIVIMISLSLVGFMRTDMTHASIQYAMARSFYIAQAGLEEAKLQVFAAADPSAYATPPEGVTEPYGSGRFTFWVDARSQICGAGLTTLEAIGQVGFLSRALSTRVRACGVVGAPFLTALFGVSRVQFQGAASRLYLAPYLTGTPGGGGSLGSFTEINFADNGVRLNALAEVTSDTVALRDGRFLDYMLFGFSTAPRYDPTPMADPAPWVLSAFGDIIKAQPEGGPAANPCGTPYACVTVGNGITDVKRISDLREANYVRHVYMNSMREPTLPRLALDPETFRTQAAQNTANAAINRKLGFPQSDSVYKPMQFYQIVFYLAANPSKSLQGTVYVDGSFPFTRSVDLGDVTLAVGGDLVIRDNVAVTIRHDLSTVFGRRTPGIVVFGSRVPNERSVEDCQGESVNWSGRFVLCEGSVVAVDGLVYTQDGMAVHARANVDQVGAMYHNNRGTANPSFSAKDATVVLRFDPLALSVFGRGVAILSWQQLNGAPGAAPAPAAPLATVPSPPAPTMATPVVASEPPPAFRPAATPPPTVPPAGDSGPDPALPVAAPPSPAHEPQRPGHGPGSYPAPDAPPGGKAQPVGQPGPTPAVPVGRAEFHVQAGAFKNRAYAADLVRQLRAQGYGGTLVEGPFIRVWVGPPTSREAAERLAAQLRVKGFEAFLSPAR